MTDIWKCGPANCNQCGREWIGVWPLGADALECPSCHGNDTDRDSVNNTRSTHEHLNLNELDKQEWFDVCKSIRAGLELDEFDLMWDEFVRIKTRKGTQ